MDINQTHLWNNIINQPPPPIDQSHHQTSTNFPSSFHRHAHLQLDHFPSPNFLSDQTENPVESTQYPTQQQHSHHSQLDPFSSSPNFLRGQTKKQTDSTQDRRPMPPFRLENKEPPSSLKESNEGGGGDEEETDEEELGAMKEMMYRMAAMQPVEIDPALIRRPRRRNVRISDDPQSVAARHRREKISEKIRILQRLVPGGTKLDTASMLGEAVRYVKFLKRQIRLLQTTSNNDGSSTTVVPPQITTRSTRSVDANLGGLDGFGIGAAAAGGARVGGGGGDHPRLV